MSISNIANVTIKLAKSGQAAAQSASKGMKAAAGVAAGGAAPFAIANLISSTFTKDQFETMRRPFAVKQAANGERGGGEGAAPAVNVPKRAAPVVANDNEPYSQHLNTIIKLLNDIRHEAIVANEQERKDNIEEMRDEQEERIEERRKESVLGRGLKEKLQALGFFGKTALKGAAAAAGATILFPTAVAAFNEMSEWLDSVDVSLGSVLTQVGDVFDVADDNLATAALVSRVAKNRYRGPRRSFGGIGRSNAAKLRAKGFSVTPEGKIFAPNGKPVANDNARKFLRDENMATKSLQAMMSWLKSIQKYIVGVVGRVAEMIADMVSGLISIFSSPLRKIAGGALGILNVVFAFIDPIIVFVRRGTESELWKQMSGTAGALLGAFAGLVAGPAGVVVGSIAGEEAAEIIYETLRTGNLDYLKKRLDALYELFEKTYDVAGFYSKEYLDLGFGKFGQELKEEKLQRLRRERQLIDERIRENNELGGMGYITPPIDRIREIDEEIMRIEKMPVDTPTGVDTGGLKGLSRSQKREVAKTLLAEAAPGNAKDMEAVAWVIRNRSDYSEMNPYEVVSAGNGAQFEGWLNRNKGYTDSQVKTAIETLDRVFSKPSSDDPTGGADHYYSPAGGFEKPAWARTFEKNGVVPTQVPGSPHLYYRGWEAGYNFTGQTRPRSVAAVNSEPSVRTAAATTSSQSGINKIVAVQPNVTVSSVSQSKVAAAFPSPHSPLSGSDRYVR